MGKIIQDIKKNYNIINWVILLLCIYLVLFFPVVSKLLEKISPVLTKCPYLQITGKPCPLCGGTRFIQNIGNVFLDYHYVLNVFGLILLIMIMEIIFRIVFIIKKENRESIIKCDAVIHISLFICYLIYSIYFISK